MDIEIDADLALACERNRHTLDAMRPAHVKSMTAAVAGIDEPGLALHRLAQQDPVLAQAKIAAGQRTHAKKARYVTLAFPYRFLH
jgi:hypothetical protein